MSEASNLVIEQRRGGVAMLTLNRPERHHALSASLSGALDEALERIEGDESVACVILTGSGEKAFCAGGDMLEMSGVEAAGCRCR
jgi:enoyl-CoA hydratase/carnithine racemase